MARAPPELRAKAFSIIPSRPEAPIRVPWFSAKGVLPYMGHPASEWARSIIRQLPRDFAFSFKGEEFFVCSDIIIPISRLAQETQGKRIEFPNWTDRRILQAIVDLLNGEDVTVTSNDLSLLRKHVFFLAPISVIGDNSLTAPLGANKKKKNPETFTATISASVWEEMELFANDPLKVICGDREFQILSKRLASLASNVWKQAIEGPGCLECSYSRKFVKMVINWFNTGRISFRDTVSYELKEVLEGWQLTKLLDELMVDEHLADASMKYWDEMKEEIEGQRQLLKIFEDVTDDNIEETVEKLKTAGWFSSDARICDCVNTMALFVEIPRLRDQSRRFAKLVRCIRDSIDNPEFVLALKRLFLWQRLCVPHFVYELTKEGIVTKDDIWRAVCLDSFAHGKLWTGLLSCVKVPLDREEQKTGDHAPLLSRAGAYFRDKILECYPTTFCRRPHEFNCMEQERENGQNSDKYALILARDDVDQLKSCVEGDDQLGLDYRIKACPRDNFRSMSLIEYAAYRNSVKCLAFLFPKGSFIWNWLSAIPSAAEGGSVDVVNFLVSEWEKKWSTAPEGGYIRKNGIECEASILASPVSGAGARFVKRSETDRNPFLFDLKNNFEAVSAKHEDISDSAITRSKLTFMKRFVFSDWWLKGAFACRSKRLLELYHDCAAPERAVTLCGFLDVINYSFRYCDLDEIHYWIEHGIAKVMKNALPFSDISVLQKLSFLLSDSESPGKLLRVDGWWKMMEQTAQIGTTEIMQHWIKLFKASKHDDEATSLHRVLMRACLAGRVDMFRLIRDQFETLTRNVVQRGFKKYMIASMFLGTVELAEELLKYLSPNNIPDVLAGLETEIWVENTAFLETVLRKIMSTGFKLDFTPLKRMSVRAGLKATTELLIRLSREQGAYSSFYGAVQLPASVRVPEVYECFDMVLNDMPPEQRRLVALRTVEGIDEADKHVWKCLFKYLVPTDKLYISCAIASDSLTDPDVMNAVLPLCSPEQLSSWMLYAFSEIHIPAAEALLKADGVRLETSSYPGTKALVCCASLNRLDLVKFIVEKRGGHIPESERDLAISLVPSCPADRSGPETKRMAAKYRGTSSGLELFRYLYSMGKPPSKEVLTQVLRTALSDPLLPYPSLEVAEEIIRSANFITNYSDRDGDTALTYALRRELYDIVALLLEHCPDIDVNGWKRSPLNILCSNPKGPRTVIEQILNHPNFSPRLSHVEEAIIKALDIGKVETAKLLIKRCDIDWNSAVTIERGPWYAANDPSYTEGPQKREKYSLLFGVLMSPYADGVFEDGLPDSDAIWPDTAIQVASEAVRLSDITLFKKILPYLDNHVNHVDSDGRSLLGLAVRVKSFCAVDFIRNHPSFDESQIDKEDLIINLAFAFTSGRRLSISDNDISLIKKVATVKGLPWSMPIPAVKTKQRPRDPLAYVYPQPPPLSTTGATFFTVLLRPGVTHRNMDTIFDILEMSQVDPLRADENKCSPLSLILNATDPRVLHRFLVRFSIDYNTQMRTGRTLFVEALAARAYPSAAYLVLSRHTELSPEAVQEMQHVVDKVPGEDRIAWAEVLCSMDTSQRPGLMDV